MKYILLIFMSCLFIGAFSQTVKPLPDTKTGKRNSPADSLKATPLRIIAFGAHPDDNELKASGVAALWAAQGNKVKFVALTNGDIGHFSMAGAPLAKRRLAEVRECARMLGIETQVLDI